MVLTSAALAQASQQRAQALEEQLNAANGKLGDGETGVMLRRVLERLASAADANCPVTSAGATGSRLGMLLTTAFLSPAKHAQGQTELSPLALAAGLAAARDAMLSRGGAALATRPSSTRLTPSPRRSPETPPHPAKPPCPRPAVPPTAFKDKPCRMGRTRMFDPGMLAFVRLLEAICGEPR